MGIATMNPTMQIANLIAATVVDHVFSKKTAYHVHVLILETKLSIHYLAMDIVMMTQTLLVATLMVVTVVGLVSTQNFVQIVNATSGI